MMKVYFLCLLILLGVTGLALDTYMEAKGLLWRAIAEVWPLWVLLMVLASIAGGFVWGIIGQLALASDREAIKAQSEADNTAYRQSVEYRISSRKADLAAQEQALSNKVQQANRQLETQKRQAEAAMKKATDTQAKADQLIADTQAENEKNRKAAFNTYKMVERIKKKHLKKLEKLSTKPHS